MDGDGDLDVLSVSVWKEADLQGDVLVRPDGKFSFPLAGDIMASGKSIGKWGLLNFVDLLNLLVWIVYPGAVLGVHAAEIDEGAVILLAHQVEHLTEKGGVAQPFDGVFARDHADVAETVLDERIDDEAVAFDHHRELVRDLAPVGLRRLHERGVQPVEVRRQGGILLLELLLVLGANPGPVVLDPDLDPVPVAVRVGTVERVHSERPAVRQQLQRLQPFVHEFHIHIAQVDDRVTENPGRFRRLLFKLQQ